MRWSWIASLAIVLSVLVRVAQGQQEAPSGEPSATDHREGEISTQDLSSSIKVQVNLVLVRVVVKDASGKEVPDLKQEDFKIWDNGKQQRVSTFNIETEETRERSVAPAVEPEASTAEPGKEAKAGLEGGAVSAPVMPKRFVMLVFDDLHIKVADSLAVRAATEKLFASLTPTDRVAIYSTQGNVQQDFTGDAATLRKALASIVPHSSRDEGHYECPNISYYQAALIEYQHDEEAIRVANADAKVNECPLNLQATVDRILQEGDIETRSTYEYLGNVVRKLAGMPGQRVLVYVSPGFLVGQEVFANSWEWIEKAVRAGVVVNTVDARGLYTPEGLPDIDAPPQKAPLVGDPHIDYQGIEGTYRMQTQFQSGIVLQSMAASTGGTYFHNRNDLDVGMSQALAAPSISYVLGFRPQSATADGKFHALKVEVVNGKKYQIQARNGYFSPKKLTDPEEEAKQEVNEMLFSRDEIAGIPLQLKTEFFRTDDTSAQLTVLTHLDAGGIRFRKVNGRSCDDLVLAMGVFDANGQFVGGQVKEVTLKLRDATLEKVSQTGLTFKTVLTVRPGTYMLRSVVRGSEGEQRSARNLVTVVPEK